MHDVVSNAWLDTPLGRSVLELESLVLADALADVFGFELLQLGCWAGHEGLRAQVRTQHHCCIAPDATGPRAIRAHYEALPVASGSVEAVLMPHTLEYAPHPHALLREVERVLMGEGQVVVCGFNPLGPWGARHLLSRGRFPPPTRRLLSEGRLRDWLGLLGLEVTGARRYLFRPPWTQRMSSGARDWLESRGPDFAALLAGAYLIKARKRLRGMTPIRPAWHAAPRVVGGLAEPTSSRNAA